MLTYFSGARSAPEEIRVFYLGTKGIYSGRINKLSRRKPLLAAGGKMINQLKGKFILERKPFLTEFWDNQFIIQGRFSNENLSKNYQIMSNSTVKSCEANNPSNSQASSEINNVDFSINKTHPQCIWRVFGTLHGG